MLGFVVHWSSPGEHPHQLLVHCSRLVDQQRSGNWHVYTFLVQHDICRQLTVMTHLALSAAWYPDPRPHVGFLLKFRPK